MLPQLNRYVAEFGHPLVFLSVAPTTYNLNAPNFGLTEISLHRFEPDGDAIKHTEYHSLLNPEQTMAPNAESSMGISAAAFSSHPTFETAIQEFGALLDDAVLVGFNLRQFDLPALLSQLERYDMGTPPEIQCLDLLDAWKNTGATTPEKLGPRFFSEVVSQLGIELSHDYRAQPRSHAAVEVFDEVLWRQGKHFVVACHKEFFAAAQAEASATATSSATSTASASSHSSSSTSPSNSSRSASSAPARSNGGSGPQRLTREEEEAIALRVLREAGKNNAVISMTELLRMHRNDGVSGYTLTNAVGKLLESQELSPQQVQNESAQNWLRPRMADLLSDNPQRRLKPLLDKAKQQNAPDDVDYVQLRVALAILNGPQSSARSSGPRM